MIRFENRFDEYSYRLAYREIASSVTALEEGQWITFDTDGKIVISDGTAAKSFLAIGSKRTDRDQVSGVSVKKIAYLHGAFELSVSNYDTNGTYTAALTALKVTTAGILAPITAPTWNGEGVLTGDLVDKIVAYAIGAPVNGYLRIISA